jgi:hypothetical protein
MDPLKKIGNAKATVPARAAKARAEDEIDNTVPSSLSPRPARDRMCGGNSITNFRGRSKLNDDFLWQRNMTRG